MKRLYVLLIMLIFGMNLAVAQSEDPLNRNLKVNGKWSNESEEVITKKKKQNKTEENKQCVDNNAKNEPKVEINNSCPDDLSVELLSLKGNRSSQEVTITIKFTNHKINEYMYIKNFLAFNQEGDEFSEYNVGGYNTLTDVPQKTSWKVGQMLPSKNDRLTALSFTIGGCAIEMRNVPIEWK